MAGGRMFWGVLASLWLVSAAPSFAQAAQSAAPASAQTREYALDLLLALHLARYDSRDMEDGTLFGGSGLLRYSFLTAGASFSAGGASVDAGVLNASLLGGLAWQTDLGLRFDLLGALGIDQYEAQDRGLFSDDPGTSATIGCAGARAGVWYRFAPRGTGHLIVGVFASYEQDFERVTQRYSYFEDSWFSSQDNLIEAEHSFGDRRLALALTAGLTFDLL